LILDLLFLEQLFIQLHKNIQFKNVLF